MLLKCQNKKCQRVWDYKGNATFYATCPSCKSSVRVREYKEKEENATGGVTTPSEQQKG